MVELHVCVKPCDGVSVFMCFEVLFVLVVEVYVCVKTCVGISLCEYFELFV